MHPSFSLACARFDSGPTPPPTHGVSQANKNRRRRHGALESLKNCNARCRVSFPLPLRPIEEKNENEKKKISSSFIPFSCSPFFNLAIYKCFSFITVLLAMHLSSSSYARGRGCRSSGRNRSCRTCCVCVCCRRRCARRCRSRSSSSNGGPLVRHGRGRQQRLVKQLAPDRHLDLVEGVFQNKVAVEVVDAVFF